MNQLVKTRVLSSLLLLALALPTPVRRVTGVSPLWQVVGTGIEFRVFYLPTPNRVYVARMDRSNPRVILESSLGQGRLIGGAETVSDMAARYDQALGYWGETWGVRNQVVVAINGYFFDSQSGVPWQGQVLSGWYVKRFDDHQNGSGFIWTLGRQAFIGECVLHPPARQLVTYLNSGEKQRFQGINSQRGEDQLIIYTPHYNTRTPAGDSGVDVLVELCRPLMIMPEPKMITGEVMGIYDGQGATEIPFDHVVLSASGSARETLLESVQVGDEIGISQEIKPFTADCSTPVSAHWVKAYAGIGGSFQFVRNGIIQGFDDLGAILRNPRTAIAFDDQYIYFIVVDGRDRFQSLGMSVVELAVFAKTYLGAIWGVALDGGGSSTMVVNGEVKNYPNADLDDRVERVVGNGMMMVVVQPMESSQRFRPGDRVMAVSPTGTQVRLGPGDNYALLADVNGGAGGVILDHANHLNGVLAKDTYWWNVAFGNLIGWSPEHDLVLE